MLLSEKEYNLMKKIFIKNKKIQRVILFGSRAKGTAKNQSDIDLAVIGLDNELEIESLAMELSELPLPYKFDVLSLESIQNKELRDHINRVGKTIYHSSDKSK